MESRLVEFTSYIFLATYRLIIDTRIQILYVRSRLVQKDASVTRESKTSIRTNNVQSWRASGIQKSERRIQRLDVVTYLYIPHNQNVCFLNGLEKIKLLTLGLIPRVRRSAWRIDNLIKFLKNSYCKALLDFPRITNHFVHSAVLFIDM